MCGNKVENHTYLLEAALWVSMAEPSHLEHTSAILKLCGFSPVRKTWSPVAALLSAPLGSSGSVTPLPSSCLGYFPHKNLCDWGRSERLFSSLSERREPKLKTECLKSYAAWRSKSRTPAEVRCCCCSEAWLCLVPLYTHVEVLLPGVSFSCQLAFKNPLPLPWIKIQDEKTCLFPPERSFLRNYSFCYLGLSGLSHNWLG